MNIPTASVPADTDGRSAKMDRAHSRVRTIPATPFFMLQFTSACTTNFLDLKNTSLNFLLTKSKYENKLRSAAESRLSIYPRKVEPRRSISVMSCFILYCANALMRAMITIGTEAARIIQPVSGAFISSMTM